MAPQRAGTGGRALPEGVPANVTESTMQLIQQWLREHKVEYSSRDNKQVLVDRARAHAAAAGGKQNKKQGQPAAAAPTLPAGVPENSRKWTITMIKQWLDAHGATYEGNETKQDLAAIAAAVAAKANERPQPPPQPQQQQQYRPPKREGAHKSKHGLAVGIRPRAVAAFIVEPISSAASGKGAAEMVVGDVRILKEGKGHKVVDGSGITRLLAESKAGNLEEIAPELQKHRLPAGGGYPPLDIIVKGKLVVDRESVARSLPKEPGVYVWAVRPPGHSKEKWIPVYVGQAGGGCSRETLWSRAGGYINYETGVFGPQGECQKFWRMLDLKSRGFDIQLRFKTGGDDAREVESRLLKEYNFPLNAAQNGCVRDVLVPMGRGQQYCRAHDDERFPVKNEDTFKMAATIRRLAGGS